jgi:hypothetical protein
VEKVDEVDGKDVSGNASGNSGLPNPPLDVPDPDSEELRDRRAAVYPLVHEPRICKIDRAEVLACDRLG